MTDPLQPAPDDKDWTWAITRRCLDCGFEPSAVERSAVARLVDEYTATVRGALDRPDAGQRPAPTTWSALEYGCHVRDVCTLFEQRLQLMLVQDDPVFANWNQDVTALEQRYWGQDPQVVAGELRHAATSAATAFMAVRADQWERPGRRSDGSAFTVDTFARYFLHDLAHHAHDVTGVKIVMTARPPGA